MRPSLNLPRPKGRGFQTPSRKGSRGPFRPRYSTGIAPTPGAPDRILPTRFPRQCPKAHAVQFGVLTEMIACMSTAELPVRLSLQPPHGGATHPWQLTHRVRQQIKPLVFGSFKVLRVGLPRTTPYSECQRAEQECNSFIVTRTTVFWWRCHHRELARWANSALTPWLKRGGCGAGLLSASYCAWNTYTFLVKYQKEPPAHLASDNLSKTHPTLGEREKNSSLADEKRQFENGLRLLPPFLARLAQGLPP